jgi:membrane protein DedA with SNARE-associated domain
MWNIMQAVKKHFQKYAYIYLFQALIIGCIFFFIWAIFITDVFKNFIISVEYFMQTKKDYVYLVAFLAAVAEGTIILSIIPGTTYTITLGVFLARGDLDPFIIFPVLIMGAFLGDLLGYALGSFSSKFVKKNYGTDKNFVLAQKFIVKHGGKSVFFARFISGIKELVPFLAGVLSMQFKRFMLWNFAGAIGWSILWVSVGYVSGSYITETESIVKTIGVSFMIFFIISVYLFYIKNKNTLIIQP